MVNRNAARHLTFVVSILLCGFMYLGYRMRTRPREAGPETITELRTSTPETAADGGNAVAPGSSLRPPDLDAYGLPAGIFEGGEGGEDGETGDWDALSQGEVLSLAPPPSSPSVAPASSLRPDPSLLPNSGNSIFGLVPDAAGVEEAASGEEGFPPSADDGDEFVPPLILSGGSAGAAAPPADASPPLALPIPPLGGGDSDGSVPPLDGARGEAVAPPSAPLSGTRPPASWPPPQAADPDAEPASALSPSLSPPPSLAPPPAAAPPNASPPVAPPPSLAPPPPAGGPSRDAGSAGGGNAPIAPRSDEPTPSDSIRIYVVRPGDTLSSIAADELGSASYADNIFMFNRRIISDPNHLVVGMKIQLPVQSIRNDPPAAVGPSAGGGPIRKPTQGLGRVHRVVRGDTLSSIAQHYYGTSAGWRFLYEANRNIMSNPNQLAVGMELSIPPYEETP